MSKRGTPFLFDGEYCILNIYPKPSVVHSLKWFDSSPYPFAAVPTWGTQPTNMPIWLPSEVPPGIPDVHDVHVGSISIHV